MATESRVPLGKLPLESPADRRALALSLETPAAQERVKTYVENLSADGAAMDGDDLVKVKAELAKKFYFAEVKQ